MHILDRRECARLDWYAILIGPVHMEPRDWKADLQDAGHCVLPVLEHVCSPPQQLAQCLCHVALEALALRYQLICPRHCF